MNGIVRSKAGVIIALAALAIFFIALLLPVKYIPLDTTQDKYHHGLFFFGLTILLYLCLRIKVWVLFIVVSIFACGSELSQKLAPQRSSNLEDLTADFYGIGAAFACIVLFMIVQKVRAKHLRSHTQNHAQNQTQKPD